MTATKSTSNQLKQLINAIAFSQEDISEKTRKIYSKMLEISQYIKEGNFTQISVDDLELLFNQYNYGFFAGGLRKLLEHKKGAKLAFTLSKRMTKTGGKTKVFKKQIKHGQKTHNEVIYEISIATTLLFQTFLDINRTITVNGIVCQDRLEALQRIFEHELIHLVELLVWGKSSCSAPQFKQLARQIFAHTEVTHQLVTQPERALKKYGIQVGDQVKFTYGNTKYTGVVNRITKRATVLVEHEDGQLYSDNKRYLKFYIPLAKLIKAN